MSKLEEIISRISRDKVHGLLGRTHIDTKDFNWLISRCSRLEILAKRCSVIALAATTEASYYGAPLIIDLVKEALAEDEE